MSDRMGLSGLTEALGETARANGALAFGAVGVLTIGNVLLDRFASQQASTLIGSFASFAAQVVVTRLATQRLDPKPLPPHVGGFFLLNLLGTLGVLAGLVFAVVPGLYLAARWLIAGPVLLVERDGVIAAMRRSWILTAPVAWPLSGLLLMLWGVAAIFSLGGGFFAGAFHDVASETSQLAILMLTYFAMSAAMVGSWLAAVATFALLRPQTGILADTFA